jgi:hypothetical protein
MSRSEQIGTSYGQTLASDKRYEGREWTDVEADARRDWKRSIVTLPGTTPKTAFAARGSGPAVAKP